MQYAIVQLDDTRSVLLDDGALRMISPSWDEKGKGFRSTIDNLPEQYRDDFRIFWHAYKDALEEVALASGKQRTAPPNYPVFELVVRKLAIKLRD
jgi:hypothetical protein